MAGGARDILVRFLGDSTKLQKAARDAEDAVEGTGSKADKVGDKLPGLNSKFGGLFDNIIGRSPAASGALDIMGKSGEGIAAGLSGTAAAAGAAGLAVAGFAAEGVKNLVESATNAQRLSEVMGGGTENASRWLEVMKPFNVELGDAQDIFGNLAGLIQANDPIFKQLGVTIAQNKDGTVDLSETTVRLIEALGAQRDSTVKASAAQKLFGEQGSRQFAPLIAQSGQLRENLDGVADALVISDEDAKSAAEMKETYKEFGGAVRGLSMTLGREVLPYLKGVLLTAEGLAKVTGGILDFAHPEGENPEVARIQAEREAARAAAAERRQLAAEQQQLLSAETTTRSANTKAAAEAADMNRVLSDSYRANEQAARNSDRVHRDVADTELVLAERFAAGEEAQRQATDAAIHLAAANEAVAEKIRDATAAADEAITPVLDYRDAQRETERAAEAAGKAVEEAKKKKNDPEAARKAEEQLDGYTRKILAEADAWVIQRGKSKESKDGAQDYINKLTDLRNEAAAKFPEVAAMLDIQIEQWRKVKEEIRLTTQTAAGYSFTGAAGSSVGGPRRETGATSGSRGDASTGAAPVVQVIVQGSVMTERDLIETVRSGLIEVNRITAGGALS